MSVDVATRFEFTQDWVSMHLPIWEPIVRDFLADNQKFLEIGSFEGRSACWWLQNAIASDGSLYCIDDWQGNLGIDFKDAPPGYVVSAEPRFYHNTNLAKGQDQSVHMIRRNSTEGLAELLSSGHIETFDLIYVDGSHTAAQTLTDACMAWPLLKRNGIMIFDDYLWEFHQPLEMRPKMGIDAFTQAHYSELIPLVCNGQFIVKKR